VITSISRRQSAASKADDDLRISYDEKICLSFGFKKMQERNARVKKRRKKMSTTQERNVFITDIIPADLGFISEMLSLNAGTGNAKTGSISARNTHTHTHTHRQRDTSFIIRMASLHVGQNNCNAYCDQPCTTTAPLAGVNVRDKNAGCPFRPPASPFIFWIRPDS